MYFKPKKDFLSFVYEQDSDDPEVRNTKFMLETSKGNNCKDAAMYLQHCDHFALPFITESRYMFAFNNGIYHSLTNSFYSYQETSVFDGSESCCNYFEMDFDEKFYDTFEDPLELPTPHSDTVLDSQGFGPEVKRWLYASWGRLLFDLHVKDDWEYFPFLKGVAGSGKSLLLNMIKRLYPPSSIGILMSHGQRNFGIEHLFDRYLFLCFDLDSKMTLPQMTWNSMVSGELMSISRKFRMALDVEWNVPGAFAGNEFPPWCDQAGNMSRRFVMFLFGTCVKHQDPDLPKKIAKELPIFLKKCVSCYLDLVEEHKGQGIWDILPDYFHRTKALLQSETNPLVSYLISEDCTSGPQETCSFSAFKNGYNKYCADNGFTRKTLTSDFMAPVFSTQNLSRVRPKPNDPHGHNTDYILGVSIVVHAEVF